ncbi:hypothetical protein ACN28S_03015 [Cystobacter fuscus]
MNAWREGHYLNLDELLRVLEQFVMGFTWKLHPGEIAPGPSAERIESVDPEELMNTLDLLRLITPDVQIIDGEILGYAHPGQELPAVVLRAVDSTSWDIESEDEEVLSVIRKVFPDAMDIPE